MRRGGQAARREMRRWQGKPASQRRAGGKMPCDAEENSRDDRRNRRPTEEETGDVVKGIVDGYFKRIASI
jgi:hypothetical protein